MKGKSPTGEASRVGHTGEASRVGHTDGASRVGHTGEASSPLRYGAICPNVSSVIALMTGKCSRMPSIMD